MTQTGAGLPAPEGGQTRGPTPLYCAQCLWEDLPEWAALINPAEVERYENEYGEPVCKDCAFMHNLKANDR